MVKPYVHNGFSAEIWVNGRLWHLGVFPSEQKAVEAFEEAWNQAFTSGREKENTMEKIGLPFGLTKVLVAIQHGMQPVDSDAAVAGAMTKPEFGFLEEPTPGVYRLTAAGSKKLTEICNRCGRGLSKNGHCHPCIEDKLLLEKYPSAAVSMHNAFPDKR